MAHFNSSQIIDPSIMESISPLKLDPLPEFYDSISAIGLQKPGVQNRDSSTATTVSETSCTVSEDFDDHQGSESCVFDTEYDSDCFFWMLSRSPSFFKTEVEYVKNAYKSRMARSEEKYFLLTIEGPHGSGKTTLARSLEESVMQVGGYFLTGKFDFLQQPGPYKGLVSAFTQFTAQVRERGEAELESMRNSILEAVGDEISVLTTMIPALESILGTTSELSSGGRAVDAMQRFQFLFTRFLESICSRDKPFVLLLDDLQWADRCSLDIFDVLVEATEIDGFFLIATYNGAIENPILVQKLDGMKQCENTTIENFTIGYPTKVDLTKVLVECDEALVDAEGIANLLCSQTCGALSVIHWFIRWLQSVELVVFDKIAKRWIWHTKKIESQVLTLGKYCYIFDEIQKLSLETQEVLKVAACLGFTFEYQLIERVLGFDVKDALDEATGKGFIVVSGSHHAFEHDIVHLACYKLISEQEKTLFHIEIGRRLWRSLDSIDLDRNIYIVLAQVELGKTLVKREHERHGFASLCLHAGIKAAKASSFHVAASFFKLGASFLDESSWKTHYELCLTVYNAAAEMVMCTGNLEEMDIYVDKVLLYARQCVDKVQAYSTRIYALGMSDQSTKALDLAFRILSALGESFPKNPCRFKFGIGVKAINRQLKRKSDDDLLRLPSMTDEKKLACMNILQLIYSTTLLSGSFMAPFVSLKMMKLTLQYGLSIYASMAFSVYGMTLLAATCDVDQADRFGKLGIELLNRYQVMAYLPRVYAAYYGCIYSWTRPTTDALGPLLMGHKVGLQTGDTEFSALCSTLYCFAAIDCGVSLNKILKQHECFQDISISNRQVAVLRKAEPCIIAVRCFVEGPEEVKVKGQPFLSLTSEAELELIRHVGWSRMAVAYLFNDFKSADIFSSYCTKQTWSLPPSVDKISVVFWSGMIALQMASDNMAYTRNMKRAKRCIEKFRNFSLNCAKNFADRLFLLEAEFAKVQGKQKIAVEKYTLTVAMSKSFGHPLIEALANERLTRLWISTGNLTEAEVFYRQAYAAYSAWGAEGKLKHLRDEMNKFFIEKTS